MHLNNLSNIINSISKQFKSNNNLFCKVSSNQTLKFRILLIHIQDAEFMDFDHVAQITNTEDNY